jgi:hypothetical protein
VLSTHRRIGSAGAVNAAATLDVTLANSTDLLVNMLTSTSGKVVLKAQAVSRPLGLQLSFEEGEEGGDDSEG